MLLFTGQFSVKAEERIGADILTTHKDFLWYHKAPESEMFNFPSSAVRFLENIFTRTQNLWLYVPLPHFLPIILDATLIIWEGITLFYIVQPSTKYFRITTESVSNYVPIDGK